MSGLSHMQGTPGHIEKHYEAVNSGKTSKKRDSCRICSHFDKSDRSCNVRPINWENNLNQEWKKCPRYNP